MDQLQQIFNYGGIEIRTLVIEEEPWFVANDVAAVLGYSRPRDAVSAHCKGAVKHRILTSGGNQEVNAISERDVYRLVMRSKLPSAEKFEEWVVSEVLPSIRKKGMYATDELLDDPDLLLKTVMKYRAERQLRLAAERVIEEQAERLTYLDEILQSEGTVCVTQIAADYDLTARALNLIIKGAGVQRKVNGQWVLTKKYLGQDLAESQTIPITLQGGRRKTKMHTRWTQAGRLLIHEILTERGIEANSDRTLCA
ncbi:phage antirepressor [Paenibacillus terrigena]|uniref:phage antirepressor n=1 Tax=Paenibacillus terrigena TaxID=369333 RepID=UPI0028D38D68|nr:phage antirepressor [Paenibacillus terrigena]